MHRRTSSKVFAIMLASTSLTCAGDNADTLAEPLKPFAPLLGKTWKVIFK